MVFPKTVLYSAMLIWRLFTYYSQLVLGAVFVITDEIIAVRVRAKTQQNGEEQAWADDSEAVSTSAPTTAINAETIPIDKEATEV